MRVETFLESLPVIDINKKVGKMAGEFLGKYAKSYNLTVADAIIGASARLNSFKLWTLNKKHYPMINKKELI